MSAIDARASNNCAARLPEQVLTQFNVDRRSPGNCRLTFDDPPINTLTAHDLLDAAPVRQDASP